MCNDIEDIKHLLFDCMHVQYVLKKLSLLLRFDVQWKHVILGGFFNKTPKYVFFIMLYHF